LVVFPKREGLLALANVCKEGKEREKMRGREEKGRERNNSNSLLATSGFEFLKRINQTDSLR